MMLSKGPTPEAGFAETMQVKALEVGDGEGLGEGEGEGLGTRVGLAVGWKVT